MKSILLSLFLLAGFATQAQDLTGIWRGSFRQGSSNARLELLSPEKYKFEVQIDQRGKSFGGVTYSYLSTVFYGKATCEGTINPATRKVKLDELRIVEVRMTDGSDACIMTLLMQYSKVDNEEFLEGTYFSMNTRDSTNCGRGTVFLRKVTTSDFYKEPFLLKREEELANRKKQDNSIAKSPIAKAPVKKPPTNAVTKTTKPPVNNKTTVTKPPVTAKTNNTVKPNNNTVNSTKKPVVKPPQNKDLAKQNPVASTNTQKVVPVDSVKRITIEKPAPAIVAPKVLTSRENELVKTITTDASEIVVNIYDNGTIDNDTISVYLDKKLVLSKQRLTDKALTLKFRMDDNADSHELVMVAENLGEIPPNTSLMVVNAGSKQYEVRITSTEQKNAVVVFKLNR